jgi:hypothetical protein
MSLPNPNPDTHPYRMVHGTDTLEFDRLLSSETVVNNPDAIAKLAAQRKTATVAHHELVTLATTDLTSETAISQWHDQGSAGAVTVTLRRVDPSTGSTLEAWTLQSARPTTIDTSAVPTTIVTFTAASVSSGITAPH